MLLGDVFILFLKADLRRKAYTRNPLPTPSKLIHGLIFPYDLTPAYNATVIHGKFTVMHYLYPRKALCDLKSKIVN